MRRARFQNAVTDVRPYGSHRFDVFGPKIGRRLTPFGRHALQLWLRLEADPQVVTYCERPMLVPDAGRSRATAFWVATNDGEQLYLLVRAPATASAAQGTTNWPALEVWCHAHSIALRIVAPDDLNDSAVLCQNRLTMLQHLAACTPPAGADIQASIQRAFESGLSLSGLERQFAEIDPSVVRTTAFSLILKGRLECPTIALQPLGPRSYRVMR